MTTSFFMTANDIIEKGIRLAGGHPTQAEELQSAIQALNLMQQEWSTRGVNLWKVEPATVTIPVSATSTTFPSDTIDVISMVVRVSTSSEIKDYQAQRISYKDYLPLTNKNLLGRPVQYLVERLKDAPRVTLWPVPDNNNFVLNSWLLKKFNDVDSPADSPDIPSKYLPAMVYGLGYYMSMERSDGSQEWENKLNRLKGEYDRLWEMAYEEDQDRVAFKIVPRLS